MRKLQWPSPPLFSTVNWFSANYFNVFVIKTLFIIEVIVLYVELLYFIFCVWNYRLCNIVYKMTLSSVQLDHSNLNRAIANKRDIECLVCYTL